MILRKASRDPGDEFVLSFFLTESEKPYRVIAINYSAACPPVLIGVTVWLLNTNKKKVWLVAFIPVVFLSNWSLVAAIYDKWGRGNGQDLPETNSMVQSGNSSSSAARIRRSRVPMMKSSTA